MINTIDYVETEYEDPSCLVEVCTLGINQKSGSQKTDTVTSVEKGVNTDNNESLQSSNVMYCHNCKLSFWNVTEFREHNEKQCRKRHLCIYCTSTFQRLDHLKRHVMSLHHMSVYNTCPTCEKDCKSNDLFLKHIKTHDKDESQVIKCRGCKYECKSLDELVLHESSHLSMNSHICTHCKKPFKRRDHMLRHIKSEHLKHQTVCPVCNHAFKRKDRVVRHLREKHKMFISNGILYNISGEIVEEK